jgi:hypothetical protein
MSVGGVVALILLILLPLLICGLGGMVLGLLFQDKRVD